MPNARGFKDDAAELLFYAHRFDDKPHQFWLHCFLIAKERGMVEEAAEFEKWYNDNPFKEVRK